MRSAEDVQAFLQQYRSAYVGEMLRGDWLRVLGKRRDWTAFEREATLYTREDLEIRCYARLARLSRGDDTALAAIESIWLEPKELPEGCARFVEAVMKRERISTTAIWQRVRVLFENGQITAAKTALGYLPKGDAPDERALAEAARQPKRHLARLPESLDYRPVREVVVLAALRYARDDPEALAKMLEGPLGDRLPPADAELPVGPRRLRGRALAPRARAEVVCARRGPAAHRRAGRMEGARRAAPRPVADGARGDRRHVARGAPRPGLDLLVRPRAGGAGRRHRRARLLPAHRRPAEFLRPARQRGARLRRRAARDGVRADRAGPRGRRQHAGPEARAAS